MELYLLFNTEPVIEQDGFGNNVLTIIGSTM